MKKGRRLKLIPLTAAICVMSFTVYIPGTLFVKQKNVDLSIRIQEIEKQIEGFELQNQELEVEVAKLKNG